LRLVEFAIIDPFAEWLLMAKISMCDSFVCSICKFAGWFGVLTITVDQVEV